MVRYFKFQHNDETIVINPSFVAHIVGDGKESVVTMNDGRRFSFPLKDATVLADTFEKLANYGGI